MGQLQNWCLTMVRSRTNIVSVHQNDCFSPFEGPTPGVVTSRIATLPSAGFLILRREHGVSIGA